MNSQTKLQDTNFAVFVVNETVLDSIYKDIVHLAVLSFCVYISMGSTFWTFITGGMFLMYIFGQVKRLLNLQQRFRTKEELQKWVDSLDDTPS